ncbi:MAG: hypothetical protein ACXAAI_09765, partial [Promethearchaeota archaeon]
MNVNNKGKNRNMRYPVVALSYFHRKSGPTVFYSYPENTLDIELSGKIAHIMDLYNERFFIHSFENLKSMNYYFEIHSDWARGNKEMLMVSTITDLLTSPEIGEKISNLYVEFSEQLQSNEQIFTAFYINDINYHNDDRDTIIKNDSLVKEGLIKLYGDIYKVLEEIRDESEEEEISLSLNDNQIIRIIEKLTERPIYLLDLRVWIPENFEKVIKYSDFEKLIKYLEEKQFIFIHHSYESLSYTEIDFSMVFPLKDINQQPSKFKLVENKIHTIMKNESVRELTIDRQYLPELFGLKSLEIYKRDGLPIFEPFVKVYLHYKGILTDTLGNTIKLKKITPVTSYESLASKVLDYSSEITLELVIEFFNGL